MVARACQSLITHEWYEFLSWPLIHTMTLCDCIQFIEHFKDQCTRLMNCAHNGPAFLRQSLQQRYTAGARRTIQATV